MTRLVIVGLVDRWLRGLEPGQHRVQAGDDEQHDGDDGDQCSQHRDREGLQQLQARAADDRGRDEAAPPPPARQSARERRSRAPTAAWPPRALMFSSRSTCARRTSTSTWRNARAMAEKRAASTPPLEDAAGELRGEQSADRGEGRRHEEHRGAPPAAGGRLQQQVAQERRRRTRTAGSTAGSGRGKPHRRRPRRGTRRGSPSAAGASVTSCDTAAALRPSIRAVTSRLRDTESCGISAGSGATLTRATSPSRTFPPDGASIISDCSVSMLAREAVRSTAPRRRWPVARRGCPR